MGKLLNSLLIKEGERKVYKKIGEIKVYEPNKETQTLIKRMMVNMKEETNEEWTRLFFENLTNFNEIDEDVLKKDNFSKLFNQDFQPLLFRQINDAIDIIIEEESYLIGKVYKKVTKVNQSVEKMSEDEKEELKNAIADFVGKPEKLVEKK